MINKTKAELIDLIEDLQHEVEKLENDVEYWQCEHTEIEEQRDDLKQQLQELQYVADIKSLDNFIWKLKLENLYSKEIEEFICNYVKYYNE